MNVALLEIFTKEEVGFALEQMVPLKTLGPDGLPAGFFQNHWALGDDVNQAIVDALNLGVMPPSLNMTNIALMLKVNNPSSVTEFRAISRATFCTN